MKQKKFRVIINGLKKIQITKCAKMLQMCSLVEMKALNMNVVGAVIILAKSEQQWQQHQYFKCRYSENVIHWELEHVKC